MRYVQDGMSVLRRSAAVVGLFACIVLLLCVGTSSFAEDTDIYRADKRARALTILDNVKEECGAVDEELQAIEGLVQDYCASSMDDKLMEKLLTKAHDTGCENMCLIEVASCVRDSIEQGVAASKATQKAEKAVTETKNWCQQLGIPLSDEEFATRVRDRIKGEMSKK